MSRDLIKEFPQVFYKEDQLVKYKEVVHADGLELVPIDIEDNEQEEE